LAPQELPLHTHAPPLHVGVAPEQALQLGPHFASVSQALHVPATQVLPAAHWLSTTHATHAPALHTLLDALQFAHVAPQWTSLLQVAHVPLWHHLPEAQSVSTEQSLQKPLAQPFGQWTSVGG
jgi:hypothetical protein